MTRGFQESWKDVKILQPCYRIKYHILQCAYSVPDSASQGNKTFWGPLINLCTPFLSIPFYFYFGLICFILLIAGNSKVKSLLLLLAGMERAILQSLCGLPQRRFYASA